MDDTTICVFCDGPHAARFCRSEEAEQVFQSLED